MENTTIDIQFNNVSKSIYVTIDGDEYIISNTHTHKPYFSLIQKTKNIWADLFSKSDGITPNKRIDFIPVVSKPLRFIPLDSSLTRTDISDISEKELQENEIIVSKLCDYFGLDYSMRSILGSVANQYIKGEPINLTKALHNVYPFFAINYFETLHQIKNHSIPNVLSLWVKALYNIGMFNIDYKIIKPVTKIQDPLLLTNSFQVFQAMANLSEMEIPNGSINPYWSDKRFYAEYDRYAKTYDISHLKSMPEYKYGNGLDALEKEGYVVMKSLFEICDLGIRTGNCLMTYHKENPVHFNDGKYYPSNTFVTKNGIIYKVQNNFDTKSFAITEYKKAFNKEVNKFDSDVFELESIFAVIDFDEFMPYYNVEVYDLDLPIVNQTVETLVFHQSNID